VDRSESVLARWARRALALPLCAALLAGVLALLPLLLAGGFAHDLLRGNQLALVRLVAFAPLYLLAECVGLVVSLALWLGAGPWRRGDPVRYRNANFRLQCVWARALLAAARRLYRLRLVVEGEEAIGRGPLLVMPRHASLADVLLPAVLVSDRRGLRLRWVMKRELLVDPCLDVVGNRLPNAFVDRSSLRSDAEIRAVAALAADLGPDDGVLIYPEGTRATPERRERALARIAAGSMPERLAQLRRLRRLLPPRTGGPLALLAAAPGADVLILGHAGLEGSARVRDLLSGALVGRTLRVRFWRHPAASVPRERGAALGWLDARWLELDAWVDARLAEAR
jgi:1-acyl-sn-glycerol-3-phosphate acyltransferase